MNIRTISIIRRIEKHLKNARELTKKDLSDYLVFNSLAMEGFQVVNSIIDLGEVIVTEKRLGFPSKYREIFEFLYRAKIINKEALNGIKRLIFLRNLISHEYYTIKTKELEEMVRLLQYVDEFISNAKKLKK